MTGRTATHRIVEINEGSELEVSWVRRGSNPMSKVFLKKSADEPPPSLENTPMLKSVALAKAMSDAATAAYFESLTKEEEIDTFLAKDEAGRKVDLDAWIAKSGWKMPGKDDEKDKKEVKKDEPAAGAASADVSKEALAKRAAEDPVVAALLKSVADLNETVTVLKTEVTKTQASTADAAIVALAKSEFSGSPLGVEKITKILKGISGEGFDTDAATEIKDLIKAHAELTAKFAGRIGVVSLQRGADSAITKLTKMAEDVAKADKISFEEAIVKISEDPANAELVAKADEEEAEGRQAAA
jgi:hypothetical protein